jgi:ABC-type Fe3+ transport system substrate-binding protein
MTVPDNAPQKDEAIDFLCYMLSEAGLEIFRKNGQNPIIPFSTEQPDKLPSKVLQYLPGNKMN